MSAYSFHFIDSAPRARELSDLFDTIWGGSNLIAAELIRAVAYGGGYAATVYDGDIAIGGSLGWIGIDDGPPVLHSHATGIAAEYRDRGVGLALKHHQRDWAVKRGVGEIRWSFDPLVRRNAWFNLARLGAEVIAYEPDFYGPMFDSMNAVGPSDRLIVGWPTVVEPVTGPVIAELGDLIVETPADIVALRRDDPPSALAWRMRLRDTLEPALARGRRMRGVDQSGSYVLR